MGFINSKKYDGVQSYHKSNKDISYYIRYKDESNKLRRVKVGDKSKGITEAFCNQKRIEIINSIRLGGEAPKLARKKKKNVVKLNDVADLYFKQREVYISGDISRYYRNYPSKLREKFGEEDIESITADKIYNYQVELKNEGLALATINYNITFLGTLFNLAIDENLCDQSNPVQDKKIKRLKVDNQRDRYLTLNEIQKIYQDIEDRDLELFTKLSLSTGGRLETILHIQVKDIKLDDNIVTLKDLKNGDTYKGFIRNDLIEPIKEHIKNNKLSPNHFIVGGKLEKYPSRTIQRKMKKIMDNLFNEGLDTRDAKNRVVIHSLRHTFASHLAINGTPIFTIQKLMNHKDIKQTMRYAKLAPDSGMDFVNSLYAKAS